MEYLGRIEGNRFITPGVSWGYGNVYPELKHRNGRWAVVKKPGSTDWESQGQSGWYPTQYWLATLRTEPDMRSGAKSGDVVTYMTVEGEEREPGHRWKAVLGELIAECNLRAMDDRRRRADS